MQAVLLPPIPLPQPRCFTWVNNSFIPSLHLKCRLEHCFPWPVCPLGPGTFLSLHFPQIVVLYRSCCLAWCSNCLTDRELREGSVWFALSLCDCSMQNRVCNRHLLGVWQVSYYSLARALFTQDFRAGRSLMTRLTGLVSCPSFRPSPWQVHLHFTPWIFCEQRSLVLPPVWSSLCPLLSCHFLKCLRVLTRWNKVRWLFLWLRQCSISAWSDCLHS